MKDVYDYLRRMFMAIFLCPVAVAFWLSFIYSGLSPDRYIHLLGSLASIYSRMSSADQGTLLVQLLFGWAVLAFAFMLISFVTSPPRFGYVLKKKNGHAVVSLVE